SAGVCAVPERDGADRTPAHERRGQGDAEMRRADERVDRHLDAEDRMPGEIEAAAEDEEDDAEHRRPIAGWNGVAGGRSGVGAEYPAKALWPSRAEIAQADDEEDDAAQRHRAVQDEMPGREETLVDLAVVVRPSVLVYAGDEQGRQHAHHPVETVG